MRKINKQFFIWPLSGLIIILATWIVVGNFIATQQEKKIDAAKAQFRKQYPPREANNSALKLEELTAKLGIPIGPGLRSTPARNLHISRNEAKAKEFDNIQKDLDNYLNVQLENPTDKIDIPPENLRQYLNSNASLLEAVEDHVLNSELPQMEILDMSNITSDIALPSFLNIVSFQKFLTLNILEKTRLGQNKEALNSLEVSWKLYQSLVKRPEIIGKLVAILVVNPQAAVMRKMSGIPPSWQSRLEREIKYNLPQSFLTFFASESFVLSNDARKATFFYLIYYSEYFDSNFDYFAFLNPLYRPPYIGLVGIDYWDKMNRLSLKLPKDDLCSFEPEEFAEKNKIVPAWWNFLYTDVDGFVSQWKKVIKLGVQMELTQKILQIKQIAAKQGNWPQSVPGIENSTICKDAQWIYQVSENGMMSITLSNQIEWLKKYPNRPSDSSLNYSAIYTENLNLKGEL
ncbi:hypothetical protein [Nodularia sp. LEGE 04288]|nr:hypothetical protein [Nodularia sp. LEGE 04288]